MTLLLALQNILRAAQLGAMSIRSHATILRQAVTVIGGTRGANVRKNGTLT